MVSTRFPILLRIQYAEEAQQYLRNLREANAETDGSEDNGKAAPVISDNLLPIHLMETTAQATQRKITLESLDLIHASRPEVQIFNNLLVQYQHSGKVGRVIPDNMVVIQSSRLKVIDSFDIPCEPARPFFVLEYASQYNLTKNSEYYENNLRKFEKELKVPFFLLFDADKRDLTLYRHTRHNYVPVKPNPQGRLAIPKLKLELALRDGWVRFWYQKELLPLPSELQSELNGLQQRLKETQTQLDEECRARLAVEEELRNLRAQTQQR